MRQTEKRLAATINRAVCGQALLPGPRCKFFFRGSQLGDPVNSEIERCAGRSGGDDTATPADVKRAIRNESILKDGRAVFNIAGNKYRIVVWINYPYRVVYIRFIGTHRQYDGIDAQNV